MAGELAQRIGGRIRQQREALGLTQGQLASRIDSDAVNNQRVSDWERGVHKPSERYMPQIAEILERDVSWFYAESVDGPTPDLMGALGDAGEDRLASIDTKLDEILSRLAALELAAGLEEEAARQREQREQSAAKPARKIPKRKAS